jgi:hypothetical protein
VSAKAKIGGLLQITMASFLPETLKWRNREDKKKMIKIDLKKIYGSKRKVFFIVVSFNCTNHKNIRTQLMMFYIV